MATGTSGGFFDDQPPQATFKHTILKTYVPPFAEMTGSVSDGRRVVVVDGYAGRGRYASGKPASGELFCKTALESGRAHLDLFLVEKQRALFTELAKVADEYRTKGVSVEAHRGNIQDHFPQVLERATNAPLFLFLDPCGALLPFADLTRVLAGPRKHRRPPTEMLMNFSADLTRRAAGIVFSGRSSGKPPSHGSESVAKLDAVCGGNWWQEVALDAHTRSGKKDFELAAQAVAEAYAARLAAEADMTAVVIPVWRHLNQQPIYHLVFLTRSTHGIWLMGNAIARARQEWLKVLGPDEAEDEGALFTFSDSIESRLKSEQSSAQEDIVRNLLNLAGEGKSFRCVDHPTRVYGDSYGIATETTFNRALKILVESSRLTVARRSRKQRDWLLQPS